MIDTYKPDDYYTAAQVAEIKGITKQAVLAGCQKNKYPGAIKTKPDAINTKGVWLVPKNLVDTPIMTKDVISVTRNLTPADLQTMIEQSVEKVVDNRINRLEKRLENHDKLLMETLRAIQQKNENKKSLWKFWK